MTIEIPEDLERRLEGIAHAQSTSVEQPAIRSLRRIFDVEASERQTSPQLLLRTLQSLPPFTAEEVDELEASIAAGRLPVRDVGLFDDMFT
jgi:hypothetical protein